MLESKLNIKLLWKRIYDYTNYGQLSREDKMFVDKIYLDIYDSITYSFDRNEYRCNINDVFDYEETSIEDLRQNLGNWLIDNKLNLVISNQFGGHQDLRIKLLKLHLFIDYNIRDVNFLIGFDNDKIADLYLGLHYGIFLSGVEEHISIDKQPISIPSRYFLLNKEINQDRLTRHFELDVVPYELKDAKNDILTIIDQNYNNEYYNGKIDMPEKYFK